MGDAYCRPRADPARPEDARCARSSTRPEGMTRLGSASIQLATPVRRRSALRNTVDQVAQAGHRHGRGAHSLIDHRVGLLGALRQALRERPAEAPESPPEEDYTAGGKGSHHRAELAQVDQARSRTAPRVPSGHSGCPACMRSKASVRLARRSRQRPVRLPCERVAEAVDGLFRSTAWGTTHTGCAGAGRAGGRRQGGPSVSWGVAGVRSGERPKKRHWLRPARHADDWAGRTAHSATAPLKCCSSRMARSARRRSTSVRVEPTGSSVSDAQAMPRGSHRAECRKYGAPAQTPDAGGLGNSRTRSGWNTGVPICSVGAPPSASRGLAGCEEVGGVERFRRPDQVGQIGTIRS